MNTAWTILGIVIALAAGALIGYFVRQLQLERENKGRQAEADRVIGGAQTKAREIELRARDEAIKTRDEAEAEASRRRAEISREEERQNRRRSELDRRMEQVEKRDQTLNKRQSALDKRTSELDELHAEQVKELQRVSGMSLEEAKAHLLSEVERESRPTWCASSGRSRRKRRPRGIVVPAS